MITKVSQVVKTLQKAVDKVNEQRQCYYVYLLADENGNVRYISFNLNNDLGWLIIYN